MALKSINLFTALNFSDDNPGLVIERMRGDNNTVYTNVPVSGTATASMKGQITGTTLTTDKEGNGVLDDGGWAASNLDTTVKAVSILVTAKDTAGQRVEKTLTVSFRGTVVDNPPTGADNSVVWNDLPDA